MGIARPIPPRYVTDIPTRATPHEMSPYRREGHAIYLRTVEYRLGPRVVGKRAYDAEGRIMQEIPFRDGHAHGRVYEFYDSGAVSCLEWYAQGLQHGTCYQWDDDGRLLGKYVLSHGTGLDVWRHRHVNGRVYASEIRTFKRGHLHGFEWWLHGRRLSSETHFVDDKKHGIERSWDIKGGLDKTYPRYWLRDERVSKRQYLAAARTDSSLPPFLERDNKPKRGLPKRARDIVDRHSG